LQGKLTYLTWPICDTVEEHFICCGDFSIFGGGFGLLLNFCMPLVVHCAKSYRPFELFANENCKLQNEAKMNATFERGSAQDPRHNPLSAEFNDAST